MEFCSNEIFEFAWFAFFWIQEIQSPMQCSICGPDPKVVIADDISVSFPSHHRTENLRPPTMPNREQVLMRLRKNATKSTCFIEPPKVRTKILEAF
jgi:hypothetical protein